MVSGSLNGAETGRGVLTKLASVSLPFIEESVAQPQSTIGRQQNALAKVKDRVQTVSLLPEGLLYFFGFIPKRQGRRCANHPIAIVSGK